MAIAGYIKDALSFSSLIRKMFEEGKLLKVKHGPENVYDFSLGNPDIEPPPEFHEVFLRLAQEDAKGSHGYMSNAGYDDVREALAGKASREHGVSIGGSRVIMAAGAGGGLNVVFKSILNPGDEVVVPTPYFMEYKPYTANHGGVLKPVASAENFDLDLGAIEAALNPKTAAVLINSPNNPTGKIYPESTLKGLADLLRRHGRKTGRLPYLVSDEPYREIAYEIDVPPVLCLYEESIAVTSYSKSLSLPGERIGYITVGPEVSAADDLLAALIYATRILGFINAPALMQRIVAELTDVTADMGIYAKRRAAFMEVLDAAGLGYAPPEGAFYIFCKIPPRRKPGPAADSDFSDLLKKHLILGVQGSAFGAPGWMRFAYCVDESIIRNSGPAFGRAMEEW
jgi:aspartate aminotransferase